MIYPFERPAEATCDVPNCTAKTTVRLALNLAGGIVFEPPQEPGWQMVINPTQPGAPISMRCKEHNRKVDTAGQKTVNFRTAH